MNMRPITIAAIRMKIAAAEMVAIQPPAELTVAPCSVKRSHSAGVWKPG